ncbi:dienelactone hydrolase family protein [Streptomyces pseudovenezuelae]|uniref:Pimeloyl-ACP methyl ester carboxylesterase n=1 Tax=Streptomyces pseudovenezuelae TaxID=67350 RepID=A0ABT6LP63_9ACTN|nr:alpha/beta hydrolase [Streptomyces pseudovenezuelae]MDH6218103.1 pimeloyl-ACP methyl ester carboxylesterase [Streptomyces pseudovenezuelae]
MQSSYFTGVTTSNGVMQHDFTVGEVTGALWSSKRAECAPLVLMGHGGGNHKKSPAMLGRAQRLVVDGGFHVACIDAPGHGDRPRTAHDEQEIAALREALETGEPVGPIVVRYNAHLAERAVPEWRAALDFLQGVEWVGDEDPVGYFGLNMGTAIGVPLTAVEPRIKAAVFGLHWPEALAEYARQITVPIEYTLQWDDEHIPRESGLALFDAFASEEKTLHANSGGHKELPRFESDSAVRFFVRQLVRPSIPQPDLVW